jgi:cysteine desulfurase
MDNAAYLDHNATTPLRDAALKAMAIANAVGGNASSVHRFGRLAHRTLEDAREQVAKLVGAKAEFIVFTSGGTEANNLALLGTFAGIGNRRVLVSAVEHSSVAKVPGVETVPVDGDGVIDLAALDGMLLAADAPSVVSIMLANNETGVIEPVAEAAAIARRHGALVHCDAIQAAGKIPLEWSALGVDLMSISAHKIGGPQGVGALIVGDGVAIVPRTFGGGQEKGRRTGTENLPGIAGFGAAAEEARGSLDDYRALAPLRDAIEERILKISDKTRIFARDRDRLPNTTMIAMPGVDAETQVMAFDLAGVAVSAGSACSSGKAAASSVLKAMGVAEEVALNAVRLSLGWTSTKADAEAFIAAWTKIYAKGRRGAEIPAA